MAVPESLAKEFERQMAQPDLVFVKNDNQKKVLEAVDLNEELIKPKLVKIKVPNADPDPEAS